MERLGKIGRGKGGIGVSKEGREGWSEESNRVKILEMSVYL